MKNESEPQAETTKLPYVAPELTVHGSLEDVTHGGGPKGNRLDASFQFGTPASDLTFS